MISVGSLLFFVVQDQVVAWSFIGGGLVVCALATLAPLSHRKRREYAVQVKPASDDHHRRSRCSTPSTAQGRPRRSAPHDRHVRHQQPTVLRRALSIGAIAAVVIAVVAGVVGFVVAGTPGLVSGLIGAAFALLFLGVTAVSLLVAGRFSGARHERLLRRAAGRAGW